MILRNAAARQGRTALVCRSSVRRALSTTPATTTTEPTEPVPTAQKPIAVSPDATPTLLQAYSTRKKQKILRESIPLLGANSAHEHRVLAWTRVAEGEDGAQQMTPSQKYAAFNRIQKNTRSLGSRVERRYVPTEIITNPPKAQDVTLELLMASQTHMGHNTSLWNPANSRYIQGVRQGIHIISLEATAAHLRRAARVVEEVAYRGGLILFVGTRKGQMEIVTKAAEMAGACHLFTKWTAGAITNRDVILNGKPTAMLDGKDKKLSDFGGFTKSMRPLMPDLVVCLNPHENYTLLYECGLKDIPTIGIIDTNADPTWVTYTIPANDDSHRSVGVIAGVLGRAGEAGQARRKRDAELGQVSWETPDEVARHMKSEVRKVQEMMKEAARRLEAEVGDFTEEEKKILQSAQESETVEMDHDAMLDLLSETGASKNAAAAVAAEASKDAPLATSETTEAKKAEASKDAPVVASEAGSSDAPSAQPPAALDARLADLEKELEAIAAQTADLTTGFSTKE